MQMVTTVMGTVKAWELNSISKTLGVCIPKTASENLDIRSGTKFRVSIDMENRRLIFEPQIIEAQKNNGKRKS